MTCCGLRIEVNQSRLMRILVAEDDIALAGFLRKGLESVNITRWTFRLTENRRAMAGELDFDLVVLDLTGPSPPIRKTYSAFCIPHAIPA